MEKFLYSPNKSQNPEVNVWMAFPGSRSFALSSIGFLWLFKSLDELENVNAEMVCANTSKTEIDIREVSLIGFSFSFDLDFINIFKMLEKYNLALKSSERKESDPLIFGGGPVLSANPEPYSSFFDFIIIGDGEKANAQAVKLFAQNKGTSKSEFLKLLSKIDGIYVPSLKQKKVKKITCALSECIYSPIISDEAFFKNTFILEITRGCANRCGFCLASYLNLPSRAVEFKNLIDAVDLGLKHTHKIALLGALIGAHPRFSDILAYIREKSHQLPDLEMSVSSLRADCIDADTVKTLVMTGQKSATIALEAGSERLRKVINKNLSNAQIFQTVKIAKENGLLGLKIYCMLGLPSETQADLNEFLILAKSLKSSFKGFDLTFSFSTFVPKPHTPFQWCGRPSIKEIECRINFLKKEFHKFGIKAKFSSAKWDFYQAILSMGDKNLGEYVVDVYKNGANLGAFKSALKKFNIPDELHQKPLGETLPWDFIELTPNKEFLKQEYKRLLG